MSTYSGLTDGRTFWWGRGILGAVVFYIATGCAAGDTDREPYAVWDSAGVRIVQSYASLWTDEDQWRISDAPVLRIGLEEGESEYLFSRLVGATRLSDGAITVGDGRSNQVRFFDSDGRFLRSVGGSGQGPGEFEHMRAVRRCGEDLVYAFDLNWQNKVFNSEGELVRESRLQDPGSGRTPYALGCSQRGEFVIIGWGDQTLAGHLGFFVATSPVWLLDSDGEVLARIGEFVSSERVGSATGSGPHPFGRATVVALGMDQAYVGTSEAFEILKYGRDGQLEGVLRGPPVDLAIKPEHIDRYAEELVSLMGSGARQEIRREVQSMPMPPSFPVYDQMEVDPDGNLWVRRFVRPGEEQGAWAVFDERGAFLGDVPDVVDLRVVEIGREYVLGIHRDALGVERVQLHTLEKRWGVGR